MKRPSMNYELIKKLKDAGFPVETRPADNTDVSNGTHYFIPTLSELIEACGEGLDSMFRIGELSQHGKKIFDKGWYARNGDDSIDGTGATPEEAVANLWLALKDK